MVDVCEVHKGSVVTVELIVEEHRLRRKIVIGSIGWKNIRRIRGVWGINGVLTEYRFLRILVFFHVEIKLTRRYDGRGIIWQWIFNLYILEILLSFLQGLNFYLFLLFFYLLRLHRFNLYGLLFDWLFINILFMYWFINMYRFFLWLLLLFVWMMQSFPYSFH